LEQALNGSPGAALALFFRTIAGGFRHVVGGNGRPSVVVPGQRLASEVQCLEDVAPRTQEILAAPIARPLKFDGSRESDRDSWKQTPLKRVESFTRRFAHSFLQRYRLDHQIISRIYRRQIS
jgi:hypothetical protein